MKIETMIYEKIKSVIPDNSTKTIFYAAISKTSYEVFFYSFIDNKPVQCFTLAEQNLIDDNKLTATFKDIVDIIRESSEYDSDKYNVATIIVDNTGINVNFEYYEKDVRMYSVKKEWKNKYINN